MYGGSAQAKSLELPKPGLVVGLNNQKTTYHWLTEAWKAARICETGTRTRDQNFMRAFFKARRDCLQHGVSYSESGLVRETNLFLDL